MYTDVSSGVSEAIAKALLSLGLEKAGAVVELRAGCSQQSEEHGFKSAG